MSKTTPRTTGFGLIALLLLLSTGTGLRAEDNLVSNGNAESADAKGNLADWGSRGRTGTVTVTADPEDKTEGKQSARIEAQGPEGVNFAVQTGRVAIPAQAADVTYLFTADVKVQVEAGRKFTAVFRLGDSDDLQLAKIAAKEGWQSLRQQFTVKANRPFARFDLSAASDVNVIVHVDNVRLEKVTAGAAAPAPAPTPTPRAGPAPAPTPTPHAGPAPAPTPAPHAGPAPAPTPAPHAGPAPAPPGAWLQQRDSDGDGQADILLDGLFYRMTLAPAKGGSIVSFQPQPTGEQLLIPDEKLGGGLLGDIVQGESFGQHWQGPWTAAVQEQGEHAVITLQRRGAPGTALAAVTLVKTLHVDRASPVVRVTVSATSEGGEIDALRYTAHNRVAATQQTTRYFMPNWEGVVSGEFRHGDGGGSQTQSVRNPPQGWLAALLPRSAGLAVVMTRCDPQTLYSWRKNRTATLEWTYGPTALGEAGAAIEFHVIAIHGLPQVDGMLGSVAAAVVNSHEPRVGGSMPGSLLLSGETGLHTIELAWRRLPSAEWQTLSSQTVRIEARAGDPVSLPFELPTAEAGTYVLRARALAGARVLGLVEKAIVVGQPSGEFHLTSTLTEVDQLGRTHRDGAIPLAPQTPLTVAKLLPTDSRLVRGFAHAPVDGRTDTRHAGGSIAEWGSSGLPAVNYSTFNGGNGLHITLPGGGFNAMQARGGWQGRVFADQDSLLAPPPTVEPLLRVASRYGVARARFEKPVAARKLSFFYEGDSKNALADVSFLNVSGGTAAPGTLAPLELRGGTWTEPQGLLRDAMLRRFKLATRVMQLGEGGDAAGPLAKGEFLHLLTPMLDPQAGIVAVTLDLTLAEAQPGSLLTVRVQDALDPLRENMSVDFVVPGPGRYVVTLDTPDQVLLPPAEQWPAKPRLDGELAPPPALWVSLACDAPARVESAALTLHRSPREVALAEAGAWRKFLLRGLFSTMSEPRPWMNLDAGKPVRQQVENESSMKAYRESLLELLTHVEVTRLLLPQDDVARQYHEWTYQNMDRRLPQPPPVLPPDDGSPRWAMLLRENWRLLRQTPLWWMEHRMTPDGQYGGGLNDDTDLFQTWQCFPMIESAPLGEAMRQASARLTDTLLAHTLEEGINRRSMDALHAYEEGVNQLAMNAWWFHGDPLHMERCMVSARSAMRLMVELPDGRLHFGGPEMGIQEARNGFAHPGSTASFAKLFLHPMYEVALYNRNPLVVERMARWGRTWAEYQKPGAFVEQVEIATGKPAKVYPHQRGPADEWTALWQVTGDDTWLQPLILGMTRGEYWGFTASYGDLPQACVRWPSPQQQMVREQFASAGYTGLLLAGNRTALEQWLERSLSWFQRFPYMQTHAEQKTDRVLNYQASPVFASYLGAAPNRNRWVRFNAVSYEGLGGDDFAALVWDAGSDRLRVALYNFRSEPIRGKLRLWRLDHGRYHLRQGPDADDDGQLDAPGEATSLTLRRHDTVDLELSPRRVTVVQIDQAQKLDDLLTRADLALSPSLVQRQGQVVRGTAHNIGSAAAEVVVAIVDDTGREVLRQSLGTLDAPLDLVPRNVPFELKLPQAPQRGWQVRLDPDDRVPEILESNNAIDLPVSTP